MNLLASRMTSYGIPKMKIQISNVTILLTTLMMKILCHAAQMFSTSLPGVTLGGKGPTNWSGPKGTPSFSFGGLIQDEGEPTTQPAFTDHTHKSQPPRPSFGSKRPRVNNLYTNRSDMQGLEAMTQPTLTDHTHKNQPPRPSFAGKRPRINNLYTNQSDTQGHEPLSQLMITGHTHNKQHPQPSFGGKRPRLNNSQSETPASNCYKCEEHLATIRRQQEEIAQLRAQGICE